MSGKIPTPNSRTTIPAVIERRGFAFSALVTEGEYVVALTGELDMETRSLVRAACVDTVELAVVVDLQGLTFMDCAGYGTLCDARLDLELRGATLTLRGARGQPARLLDLLSKLEDSRCALGECTIQLEPL